MGKLKRVIELFQMVWNQLEAEAIKFIFDFRFYGFSSEKQKAQWEMENGQWDRSRKTHIYSHPNQSHTFYESLKIFA